MAQRTGPDPHSDASTVGRRDFFKGAALGAAGLVGGAVVPAEAAPPAAADAAVVTPTVPSITLPTERDEFGPLGQPTLAQTQASAAQAPASTPASDYMVDVLKKIGFEYCAINPGSTFQGLHESFINHGNNTAPELLTCLHEEAAAAMAHGYAKAAGRPMLTMFHGTVGLLHSSMALFQAWADRVPVVRHRRAPPEPVGRHQPPAQRAGHGLHRPRLREVRRRSHHAGTLR